MRLDKFLKVSRIIKRRPVAKIVIDGGKAKLNGRVAKSGSEVKVGNILELEYYDKYFKFEILEVPNGAIPKERAKDLIRIIETKGIKIDFETEEEIFEKKLEEIRAYNRDHIKKV
ncbi:MAG: RNA-binding S4 domain-containing protein [Fusobacteriaceae bacterium]|jgi:ribosomal 50S subunit-recycling heat shock protein|nr:RNA-binding S4 domain-containing protein [Fusobacteriaceae bacterium]